MKLVFQFHKGTIRTFRFFNFCENYFNFNSIKVRLEPPAIIAGAGSLLFQFHKGTIRTETKACVFHRY